MNTRAMIARSGAGNLPGRNPGAAGYIALEPAGHSGPESQQSAHFWNSFRRYWWVVLLIWVVIAIPATLGAYLYLPSQYVAKNAVEVSPVVTNPVNGTHDPNPFFDEYLRTQAEMMKDPFVLQRAAEDVRLRKYPWFRQLADQVRYLDDHLVVTCSTEAIWVSMTHKDAEAATAIVDAVIDSYFRARNELDEQSIDKSLRILKGLQATTDKSLRDAQEKLSRLELDGGGAWSEDDRKVLTAVIADAGQTLGHLQGREIELSAQRETWKNRQPANESLYKASVLADANPLRRQEIQERAWVSYQASFELERATQLAKADADLATLKDQIAALQKSIAEQEETARQMGNKAQPILALKEQIADSKDSLKRYSDRISEIENQTRAPGRVILRAPTVQPQTPIVDLWPKVAAAGNVGGFSLGLLVLVILVKLRDKIDRPDDLPESYQPLIVGTVSHAGLIGSGAAGVHSPMRRKIFGEEMQILRANLLPPGKNDRRVIMITSPTPANGKTSIASHLALSLAKSGQKVLLVDADLRKRDLTAMFDLEFRPGLSDLFQGNPPDLVSPMELLPDFRIMGAGRKLEGSPGELLLRRHFREALGTLQGSFDCIVIDTPPMLVVADARLIARACDEVLCVVRANVSSPKEIHETLDALARITGKAPKIIVNGVAQRQSYYRYKYDYIRSPEDAGVPRGAEPGTAPA